MPTTHRQNMIDQGYAPKHHGHDAKAVKLNDKLEKDNQARQKAFAGKK